MQASTRPRLREICGFSIWITGSFTSQGIGLMVWIFFFIQTVFVMSLPDRISRLQSLTQEKGSVPSLKW